MRILVVATKSPWPPRDGGRLALWLTLEALAADGHALALVAPVDTAAEAQDPAVIEALARVCRPTLVVAPRRAWPAAAFAALRDGCALTVARHRSTALSRAVAAEAAAHRPDVVHAEQVQAWANTAPARAAGVPALLRMQNVESSLWAQSLARRGPLRALAFEAARVRRDEARAIAAADAVVALTSHDADALRGLAPAAARARIVAIAPPFPAAQPSAPPLPGDPAVVLVGSAGWRPNEDGADWFFARVLPLLRTARPALRVHAFGLGRDAPAGVDRHAAPADAIDAFPAGAIAAVPLQVGSGIRVRILEAWSRGLPVVATSIAARGFDDAADRELLVADDADAFAAAIIRVSGDAALRAQLVAAGRARLAREHAPRGLAARLADAYRDAVAVHDARGRSP